MLLDKETTPITAKATPVAVKTTQSAKDTPVAFANPMMAHQLDRWLCKNPLPESAGNKEHQTPQAIAQR